MSCVDCGLVIERNKDVPLCEECHHIRLREKLVGS